MLCEHYQNALVEAAAKGSEPQETLRAHLAACAHCSASFAAERQLFAAIDNGLNAAVIAEVPASLLPRVRARLDEEAAPRRSIQQLVFAGVGMAFILAISLTLRPHHGKLDEQANQIPTVPSPEMPATDAHQDAIRPSTAAASATLHGSQIRRFSHSFRAPKVNQPEVIMPHSEREAFIRFVSTLKERNGVALALLALVPDKPGEQVNVDLLNIPGLEIKPLEGQETQTSNHADEEH